MAARALLTWEQNIFAYARIFVEATGSSELLQNICKWGTTRVGRASGSDKKTDGLRSDGRAAVGCGALVYVPRTGRFWHGHDNWR